MVFKTIIILQRKPKKSISLNFDHFTGLPNVPKRIFPERSSTVDIFLYPDAFLRQWEIYPDGKRARLPFLDEKQLKELGAAVKIVR